MYEELKEQTKDLIEAVRKAPELNYVFYWVIIYYIPCHNNLLSVNFYFLFNYKPFYIKLKDGTLSSGKKIVIDGQQRITALTAAIAGHDVVNQEYKKVRIKISFNPINEIFEVYNPAIGKDSKMIDDISVIFEPGFDSFNFSIEYHIIIYPTG